MGVLRMVVTGSTENKKPWWQPIGTAANNEVGQKALEKIAKNYAKGTFLQLQEKRDKKNITHFTIESTASEDKHKDFGACEVWSRLESDQLNAKELKGTDYDTTWLKTLTFTNHLDAATALAGIADVTPKNTTLILGSIDDNGGWHVEDEVSGRAKAGVGGTNADLQEETSKKKQAAVN